MPPKIKLDKQFVEFALDVYQTLDPKERENIKYKDLIEIIMRKLNGEKFKESHIKRGYEQFKSYYLSHSLTKLDKFPKTKDDYVSLDDIEPLLRYDIFKKKTRKILTTKNTIYRYYWFDQAVTNQYYQTEKRRILIFESDAETTKSIYKLSTRWFDFYESVYCGSGGMVAIFLNAEEKHFFKGFLECISKK